MRERVSMVQNSMRIVRKYVSRGLAAGHAVVHGSVLTVRVAETVRRPVQVELAGRLVDAVGRGRRGGRDAVPVAAGVHATAPLGRGRDRVPLVPLELLGRRHGGGHRVPLVPFVPLAVVGRLAPLGPLPVVVLARFVVRRPLSVLAPGHRYRRRGPRLIPLARDRRWLGPAHGNRGCSKNVFFGTSES